MEYSNTQNAPRASPKKTEETPQKVSKSSSKTSRANSVKEKVVSVSAPTDSNETNTSIYSELVSTWAILLDPIYYSVLGFIILITLFGIDHFLQNGNYSYSSTRLLNHLLTNFISGNCHIFPNYSTVNDYVESLGLIMTLLISLTVGLFIAVVGPFKLVANLVSKVLKINQINANIMLLFTVLALTARFYQDVAPALKK